MKHEDLEKIKNYVIKLQKEEKKQKKALKELLKFVKGVRTMENGGNKLLEKYKEYI